MDATQLLKQQHDEVKELFAAFENASDPEEKDNLVAEIADNLAAHAAIEEQLFYPAVYVDDTKDELKEAVEEHLSAKRIIADLLELDVSDDNFDAKVKVLKEQIEHHVQEEEQDLFPKARKVLQRPQLEGLGQQMSDLFERLIANDPREQVPAETGEAAPLTR